LEDRRRRVLYVSFHTKGNVHAVSKSSVSKGVLGQTPAGVMLDELRGLAFGPDGLLWVVSGGKKSSQILRFQSQPASGQHAFVDLLAAVEQVPGPSLALLVCDGMVHPFDVTFGPGGDTWFVSCQDTNLVLGPLPVDPPPQPEPTISEYLVRAYAGGSFPPWTFVGSTVADLPEAPPEETTAVAPPPGLAVELQDGKPQNSVRGLANDGTLLYVADEPASLVKAYAPTGDLFWAWPPERGRWSLSSPVHLLYDSGSLYVGNSGNDGNSVLCVDLSDGTASVVAVGVTKASGLALDPSGNLYVGSRGTSNDKPQIYVVSPGSSTPAPYGPPLDDEPEFLLYVPDSD
jgi:hypothetical protein